MTVSDMNIASLLDVFDYALVLIYGLALDVFISGGCDTPRQKRLIAYLCPCFLVVQLLGWLTLGELAVKQIYPLIVHLPLVLILVLALKKPWGIAIVSTATAYLCCQPPRWGSMAVEALTHSAVAGNLVYIVLLSGSFYLFRRYFVAAAYGAMTSSPTALLLFGSLPCSYYIFDYATTIYSDALYSGIQALNEFLPTVLVVFYVLFLPAFHVQSQKRSSAEMQRSLLEVELKQSQQEMDSLRQSEMQTAVYQHDMRHHLNMISGLLASGSPQQAQEYIQKVQSDVEAITSRRFCENETVNLLCSSFVQKAEKSGVTLNVDARVPAHLPISDTELCSLLSNALENALRAASTLQPEFRRTVDLYCGIRLEGEGAWGLTRQFMYLWLRMGGELRESWDSYRPRTAPKGGEFCQPLVDGPDNNPVNTAEDTFQQLISNANRYIWITTPYLAIDEPMIRTLCIAADSGVDVRLMLPGIPDHKFAYMVALSYFGELLEHDVKIFTYTPGLLHAKSVVADGDVGFVGSVNMDYRSFQLHFECGVLFSGSAVTAVREDMDRVMAQSERVTLQGWRERKWYVRLLGTVLRPFAMWM